MSSSLEAPSIVATIFAADQAGALIVLHVLPTGYNPIRDAVSDYGVGPYRAWFWLQAVAGGVACLALAIALSRPVDIRNTSGNMSDNANCWAAC